MAEIRELLLSELAMQKNNSIVTMCCTSHMHQTVCAAVRMKQKLKINAHDNCQMGMYM